MQSVIAQVKKLGKPAYLFSVDAEGGKIVHVNFAPSELRAKGLDARSWAAKVAEVLGGKVSRSPDSVLLSG